MYQCPTWRLRRTGRKRRGSYLIDGRPAAQLYVLYDTGDVQVSADTDFSASSSAEQVLVNYFRAKDGNRPHLLERVFSVDAQLEVKNASSSISFPAMTRGREQIADVLVREFGRTYENVYSFYLSDPPSGPVEQFSCSWLVGMTEKSGKTVRVGCGRYEWSLVYEPTPCATALVISIEAMQVLAPPEQHRVLAWLEGLHYPWSTAAFAARTAPAIAELMPVLNFLRRNVA
jgi:hypothetical protein